jgi:drug/metabolite transporter (DMT)-like permease
MSGVNKAILYMLFASLMFAFMGVLAKKLSYSMSSIEVVFFRNVFGVVVVSISFFKFPIKQVGGKPLLLFFRGFVGFLALLMFFYNIAHISIAEAMTFSKTSPIFTAIFAYLFIKESLSLKSWIGILIGFIGILFITDPNFSNLTKTDYLGILTGVGAALAYTSVRELKSYYDTRSIVLSFMLIGTIGPIFLMVISEFFYIQELDFMLGKFTIPYGDTWIYILLLGLFSTLAQLSMTKAYGEAKAGIVGAVGYMNIVFSILLGYFILDESLPNLMKFVGIALIVTSGIIVSREK